MCDEVDGGDDEMVAMVSVAYLAYTTVDATTVAIAANVLVIQPISSRHALDITRTPAG